MKHTLCPCCRSADCEDFFTIKKAPAQSLVTIESRDDALAIPRRDIILSFCNGCGFIFNSAFDPSIDYFTQGYEDQQGFSPTFVKFLSTVAECFIDKYGIRNKQVVEIGCGKGDYLKLFCKIGGNRGIGIDPAWVPGRGDDVDGVTFLRESYAEKHGTLNPDCITCRHTLEHIHDPADFLRTMCNSLRGNQPAIFFEVPNVVQVLDKLAFWDIFCEHCSYFSPGSLARLFRAHYLTVLNLFVEYDEQYLFIEARPGKEDVNQENSLEETVRELKEKTINFAERVTFKLAEWRRTLLRFKQKGAKVVLWGGGSKSVGFLTHFDDIDLIKHVIDINPYITGKFIPGIGIQYSAPDFLEEYCPDVVIVMNSVYLDEIRENLSGRGLHPEVIGL